METVCRVKPSSRSRTLSSHGLKKIRELPRRERAFLLAKACLELGKGKSARVAAAAGVAQNLLEGRYVAAARASKEFGVTEAEAGEAMTGLTEAAARRQKFGILTKYLESGEPSPDEYPPFAQLLSPSLPRIAGERHLGIGGSLPHIRVGDGQEFPVQSRDVFGWVIEAAGQPLVRYGVEWRECLLGTHLEQNHTWEEDPYDPVGMGRFIAQEGQHPVEDFYRFYLHLPFLSAGPRCGSQGTGTINEERAILSAQSVIVFALVRWAGRQFSIPLAAEVARRNSIDLDEGFLRENSPVPGPRAVDYSVECGGEYCMAGIYARDNWFGSHGVAEPMSKDEIRSLVIVSQMKEVLPPAYVPKAEVPAARTWVDAASSLGLDMGAIVNRHLVSYYGWVESSRDCGAEPYLKMLDTARRLGFGELVSALSSGDVVSRALGMCDSLGREQVRGFVHKARIASEVGMIDSATGFASSAISSYSSMGRIQRRSAQFHLVGLRELALRHGFWHRLGEGERSVLEEAYGREEKRFLGALGYGPLMRGFVGLLDNMLG